MSRLGVDVDRFRYVSVNSKCFRFDRPREAAGVEDVDLNIIQWIDVVQTLQDEGETWADAVAAANEAIPNLSKDEGGVNADLC